MTRCDLRKWIQFSISASIGISLTCPLALSAPKNAIAEKTETKSADSLLTTESEKFLGTPPKGFKEKYLAPAKKLKAALLLKQDHADQAIKALIPLAQNGEYAEHASYELALLYREKKEFQKSLTQVQRLLFEMPPSAYSDQVRPWILDNRCELATQSKKKNDLLYCLQNTPWKEWNNREDQIKALYELLKKSSDPLLGSFVAEAIQALPSTSPLRTKFGKEIPNAELKKYAQVPRYRTGSINPSGVKAINPDADLFDQGMVAVLEGKFSDAQDLFKKMIADFPQSDHGERARYWIARTSDLTGKSEDAKQRYEQIFQENPLGYYGLQSALRLKRDLRTFFVPSEINPKPMEGTPLIGQARSLWKIRALLEVGLLEQTREEAEFLFQSRPGSFTFGQDNAEGAILVGQLYQAAGYHLAAFSHAYAATTLDPAQLNLLTLDLIFPQVFQKEFEEASMNTNIHPLLLASLTKQESAFLPNALSRADAYGLMQLIPTTAKEVDPKIKKEQLFLPKENIRLGSKYLQKLLEKYQGSIALALAGYNAGPNRANQWQKKMLEYDSMKKNFDVEVFIDTIPFTETRKYVGSILRNFAWYKLLNKDGSIESVQELASQWQRNQKVEQPATPPTPPESIPLQEQEKNEEEEPATPLTPKSSDTSAPTAV